MLLIRSAFYLAPLNLIEHHCGMLKNKIQKNYLKIKGVSICTAAYVCDMRSYWTTDLDAFKKTCYAPTSLEYIEY